MRQVDLGPIGILVLPKGTSFGRLLAACEEKTFGLSELAGDEHTYLSLKLRASNRTPATREQWMLEMARLYENEYETWVEERKKDRAHPPPARWDRALDWVRRTQDGQTKTDQGARLIKASTR